MYLFKYKYLFVVKIVLGIVCIAGGLWYYATIQSQQPVVIFLVDMHTSMGTQDIPDYRGQVRTRQQAAMAYVDHILQEYIGLVGIVRLGYYPDYILPPTQDSGHIASYIQSLAVGPLAEEVIYDDGLTSLATMYEILPTAQYILLTDKRTTQQAISSWFPGLQTVIIGDDIQSWYDIERHHINLSGQKTYLGWILWGIIVLGLFIL